MDLIIENEIDISTKSNKVAISNVFTSIISTFVEEEEYVKELNFDIVKDGDNSYSILSYNNITALWLSGYLLPNPEIADEEFYILDDDKKMCYDRKSLKLIPYEEE